MPSSDFESAVMKSLGEIGGHVETIREQVSTLFHKIEGNGQPGISQRLAVIETTCKRRQEQVKEDAENEAQKKDLHWSAWVAVAAVVIAFFGDLVLHFVK
jgi:fatty acid-binding protein DegV